MTHMRGLSWGSNPSHMPWRAHHINGVIVPALSRYHIDTSQYQNQQDRPRTTPAQRTRSLNRADEPLIASAMSTLVRQAVSGAAFGAALCLSGVWVPSVVLGQLRLEDFRMLRMFLTASGASM